MWYNIGRRSWCVSVCVHITKLLCIQNKIKAPAIFPACFDKLTHIDRQRTGWSKWSKVKENANTPHTDWKNILKLQRIDSQAVKHFHFQFKWIRSFSMRTEFMSSFMTSIEEQWGWGCLRMKYSYMVFGDKRKKSLLLLFEWAAVTVIAVSKNHNNT